jgi:anion-transporting  ArsA/GET3 family ATPase
VRFLLVRCRYREDPQRTPPPRTREQTGDARAAGEGKLFGAGAEEAAGSGPQRTPPPRTREQTEDARAAGEGKLFGAGAEEAAGSGLVPVVPDLLDERLVVVTGKGGVGKSTVALALGLAAAASGRRTIVCEVSSAEHTSRVFHRAEVGFHEVEMADNLWAISIDPDEAMREYVLLQLRVRAMRDMLFRSRIFTYLAAATPGLRELVTIGKIWEVSQPDRKVKRGREYDLVIVDAPATGHGVGFLQTPRTFANIARVGPIKAQAEALETFIVNHRKTGVAIVAMPEEMAVNETAALERTLVEEVGVSVDRVYMNALYPERFTGPELERLEAAGGRANGGVRGACRAALSEGRRAAAQHQQLARLAELVQAPLRTLPFIFDPEVGVEEIRELASELA